MEPNIRGAMDVRTEQKKKNGYTLQETIPLTTWFIQDLHFQECKKPIQKESFLIHVHVHGHVQIKKSSRQLSCRRRVGKSEGEKSKPKPNSSFQPAQPQYLEQVAKDHRSRTQRKKIPISGGCNQRSLISFLAWTFTWCRVEGRSHDGCHGQDCWLDRSI